MQVFHCSDVRIAKPDNLHSRNAPDKWNSNQEKLGGNVDEMIEKLGRKAEKLGRKLGKTKIAIIRLIYQDQKINTIQMAEKIGISTTSVDNNIRQMRDVFIKHVGPTKGGHWEIITD